MGLAVTVQVDSTAMDCTVTVSTQQLDEDRLLP